MDNLIRSVSLALRPHPLWHPHRWRWVISGSMVGSCNSQNNQDQLVGARSFQRYQLRPVGASRLAMKECVWWGVVASDDQDGLISAHLYIHGEGESSNVCISSKSKPWVLRAMKLGGMKIYLLPHMFSQSGENYILKTLLSLHHSFAFSKILNASCCPKKPTPNCFSTCHLSFPIKLKIVTSFIDNYFLIIQPGFFPTSRETILNKVVSSF